ncbi:pilus assembly protein TadG-related protein [Croceicoccus bisphenolivorans]|uniref:pilus assembly protein TadG-related protein n=1 Tax=Croceicoccus bisphenolivorans TaxID=1783232 RepID=UPI00082E191D|nr:pilus assembly protein TadG-related protein [Croceicoccus bisphenolivorans]
MLNKCAYKLLKDDAGAIAPLYALALFGLVGMAGVGFDYARVMAMDTELQNAADQLALAAATQLDQKVDSIGRAETAATSAFASDVSAFTNITRLSNIDDDGDGKPWIIENVSFRFWQGYDRAADAPVTEITDKDDGSNAQVVEVTVGQRALRYALTPIVGAIVGRAGATAMASMESAYCKVPPMMVCAPTGDLDFGAFDPDTNTVNNRGEGARLHLSPSSTANDPMAPGLFGFLNFPYPGPGGNPNQTLGWNVTNPGCTGETVESLGGDRALQVDALNTRLDIYRASAPNCAVAGDFCPSKNATKDQFIATSTLNNTTATDAATAYAAMTDANCPDLNPNGNPSWVRYDDVVATNGVDSTNLRNPGYPRDTCHVNGSCSADVFGNGSWNIQTYLMTTHRSAVDTNGDGAFDTYPAASGLGSTSTRYDVYKWENTDADMNGVPDHVAKYKSGYTLETSGGGKLKATYYCAYPKPVKSNGIAPPTTIKDRRILSVAVVNCTGAKQNDPVDILRYIDVFLVKPAKIAGDQEFYVEVVGEDVNGGANTTFQNFAKRKAVLIR